MLTSPKTKKWYLDIPTEELFSGNHLYFIKSSQIIYAIISRRIEDKISKRNPLLEIQFKKKAQNGYENAVIKIKVSSKSMA